MTRKIFILAALSIGTVCFGEYQQAPSQQAQQQRYRYQYYQQQGGAQNAAQQQRQQNIQQYQQQQQQAAQQQGQQQYQQQQQQIDAAKPQAKQVFSKKDKDIIYDDPEKLIALSPEERKKALEEGAFDFKDENAYIDVEDALHYKRFVHRHLLSKAIADSKPVSLNRFFLNLLTTTSYVHQQGDGINVKWIEFVTGGITLSGGYALGGGHMFEVGANMSAISTIFFGYRYFFGTDIWSVWPYAGLGYGIAMKTLNLSDGPDEVQKYIGANSAILANLGVLLPMPDVAVRIEVRMDMWGSNRLVVTPSFGLVLYM